MRGEKLMNDKNLNDYNDNEISELFYQSVDAIVIADSPSDTYRTIVSRGIFKSILKDEGVYHDLIVKLWFHVSDTNMEVIEDYQTFADNTGIFKGKYSRRLKINVDGDDQPHIVQMTV